MENENTEKLITAEGKKKLEEELLELTTVKRSEIAELLKTARGYGDLSENSEYEEAKNKQGLLEARINTIKTTLKEARVVDKSELSSGKVLVGCRVKVKEGKEKAEWFTIVGTTEADPINGKISDESAIGRGLKGHEIGDTVEITVPSGDVIKYKIMDIKPAIK